MLQIGIAEMLHYKAQEVLSLKTPWIEIHLLLSNTPLHTYALVKQFLNSEKVTVFQHPSYYLVFFFSRKPKMFYLVVVKSRQAIYSAISQCLRGLYKLTYHDAFQKWIQRLILRILNCGEDFEEM